MCSWSCVHCIWNIIFAVTKYSPKNGGILSQDLVPNKFMPPCLCGSCYGMGWGCLISWIGVALLRVDWPIQDLGFDMLGQVAIVDVCWISNFAIWTSQYHINASCLIVTWGSLSLKSPVFCQMSHLGRRNIPSKGFFLAYNFIYLTLFVEQWMRRVLQTRCCNVISNIFLLYHNFFSADKQLVGISMPSSVNHVFCCVTLSGTVMADKRTSVILFAQVPVERCFLST